MPNSVRIRPEYKQPFDQQKFVVVLLTVARQRLEAAAAARATAEDRRDG
jgi:hypothetical protein